MNERLLTPAEIARLEAAGIRYPWSGRQSLDLLEERDSARRTYDEQQHEIHQLRTDLATARAEATAARNDWLDACGLVKYICKERDTASARVAELEGELRRLEDIDKVCDYSIAESNRLLVERDTARARVAQLEDLTRVYTDKLLEVRTADLKRIAELEGALREVRPVVDALPSGGKYVATIDRALAPAQP